MKKYFWLGLIATQSLVNAQVLIDDAEKSLENPDANAILELRSESKALLLPRLSSEAIESMQNVTAGMLVFDKTQKVFKAYNGEQWIVLGGQMTEDSTAPVVSEVDFSGNLKAQQTLTGTYEYTGDAEGTSLFAWNVAQDDRGTNSENIGRDLELLLTENEVGKYIQFCVTPVDDAGLQGNTQCSVWKEVVENEVAPIPENGVLLTEGFDGLAGNNTDNKGSSSSWGGNDNFPVVEAIYQAGDALRMGSSKKIGKITSKPLTFEAKPVTVSFDVKGWTNIEGDLVVTLAGQSQTISYQNTMSDSFEHKSITFQNISAGDYTISIETTSKRAFLDNIRITQE